MLARVEGRAPPTSESGDFARVVAFSDGVFAIAITLLVLSIQIPFDLPPEQLDEYLADSWGQVFAYFLSFAVIGRFWLSHHYHFNLLRHVDDRLLLLNLVYLAFIVLVPFPTAVLGDFDLSGVSVALYAFVVGTAALLGLVMVRYSIRHELGLPGASAALADMHAALWSVPIVFYASIPVGFLNAHAGALIWLLLLFDGVRTRARKR